MYILHVSVISQSEVLVTQSCPTLFDHMDWTVAHQAPLSMEFSRILEWVAISFSRGSSLLKDLM